MLVRINTLLIMSQESKNKLHIYLTERKAVSKDGDIITIDGPLIYTKTQHQAEKQSKEKYDGVKVIGRLIKVLKC